MLVLAAAGDTWGISGPAFLFQFLVAAVILLVAALVHRRFLLAGQRDVRASQIRPEWAAYLNGGSRLAIYSALGSLRGSEAIEMSRDGGLAAPGRLPAGASPLDQAVYNAAAKGIRPRELATDQWVARAIGQLREELVQAGLSPSRYQRRAALLVPVLMLGLLGVGLARLWAGIAADKPVLLLILVVLLHTVATLILLFSVPRRTRAARKALGTLRATHTHLSPASSPAYSTYGATGAAMGVALFGGASLWALDPGFAGSAEVQRNVGASGAGGGGGCGGSSSGDGSGGGGCGGGGCGGCGG
jgi:uncharacterized protein (TIGR04222 family)